MRTLLCCEIVVSLLLLPTFCKASLIEECGIYQVEGFLTTSRNDPELIHKYAEGGDYLILQTDKGSQSQVNFNLGHTDHEKYRYLIGTNVEMKIRVSRKCMYECFGEVVEPGKSLHPARRPKSFARTMPAPQIKESCK